MSISLLGPQSSEILTLAILMPYSSVDVETKMPVIGWIKASLHHSTIILKDHLYTCPTDASLLKETIQTISQAPYFTSHSIQSHFPYKISCLFSDFQTTFSITQPIQLLQLLSSLLGYLKTQVLYSSLRRHVSTINKKSLLSDITPSILAAQQHLQTLFLDLQATSPIESSLHSSSPPALTTLASLAVLKLPTIQPKDSIKHCSCTNIHRCFDENLQNHSTIKILSPLLRSMFSLNELFNNAHQSLELKCSFLKDNETPFITLEAYDPKIAPLKLLSYTTKCSHTITTTRIIQSQIMQQALASPLIHPPTTSLSMNLLTSKLLGNDLYLEYEELVNIKRNFRLASVSYMSPRDEQIINLLIQRLSNMLEPLPQPTSFSTASLYTQSLSTCIWRLLNLLFELSNNLYSYVKEPSPEKKKLFLSSLKFSEKKVPRKLDYLNKVMLMNQELWLKDFLFSVESTINTAQKKLTEVASRPNMHLDPNLVVQ
ncbi:hypothetical protein CLAVI_000120 [Candidatus Clavichlamydia salmonicola]|uniref:hypothetical protein n=1 Tax=Candidatus Clavichlamydia salmonicola TaxID=469812 RepID=UPI001890E7D6|nr:hypothetical protein [Candidatus Clavichlamydia salmonicola]MBF5050514.1 hypothetical protein [Candidatus Clavichlamydia salmonicola]